MGHSVHVTQNATLLNTGGICLKSLKEKCIHLCQCHVTKGLFHECIAKAYPASILTNTQFK